MKKILSIIIIGILIISGVGAGAISQYNSSLKQTSVIGDYDLVIITPDMFSDNLQPLIDHKISVGIKTFLKTTEDIYDEYEGRDQAEQIKYFIKEAYDKFDISYVLLIGGRKPGFREEWFAPVRYATFRVMGYQTSYISDLYFADLYDENHTFQKWDENNDDVFGTLQDNIDCNPDISIGRWPCRTVFELNTMIEKTISYESYPIKQKKIVLVGGDTFSDTEKYNEGELITSASAQYLDDFEVVTVFSSETIVSTNTIQQVLGDGATFMHFKGHGWVIYWNTYANDKVWEESEPGIGIWNIPRFSNSQYPIIVFGGCYTAMCNVSVFNHPHTWHKDSDLPILVKYLPALESITWSFTRKPHGGSIAGIGYTGMASGWYGESGDLDDDGVYEPDCVESGSGFLEISFFEAYGKKFSSYLGPCINHALKTYITTHGINDLTIGNIQKFILFGDPSLKIGGYAN